MNYKAICRYLLLLLGWEVPRQNQTVNLGWLLLVLGLGLLSKFKAPEGSLKLAVAYLRGFRKF